MENGASAYKARDQTGGQLEVTAPGRFLNEVGII
jgi:hypothetical protein